ncbi:hypothetical protein EMCRGX_G034341 [Ephydatia muelleri]
MKTRIVEVQMVEAGVVEARIVEARIVEARIVEARIVEAQIVEVQIVEARIVEVQIVEARIVEARALKVCTQDQPSLLQCTCTRSVLSTSEILLSIHHSQFLIASYCWNARAPVTPRWEETLVLDVHIYDIPHHLVMLPPMMNMEFYDIDIVMAMQLPHYRLHKTFVLTYKSTKTRRQWNVFLGFAGYMQSEKATTRDTELALED